ncbi:MAG: Rrf2 family transcriptional regulator [Elusimicrobia bacterium]|nr:Rrf2 family transcriptional regulator [Candidatus Liberimonas magnetica]
MKLSARTRYGMRLMTDLAMHAKEKPVLLKDICGRYEYSLKYLDHIITNLKLAGLIRNVGGGHGGYMLSRPSEKIYAFEVVNALEGQISFLDCVFGAGVCGRTRKCVQHKLWKKVRDAVKQVLNVTLAELAKEQAKTPFWKK